MPCSCGEHLRSWHPSSAASGLPGWRAAVAPQIQMAKAGWCQTIGGRRRRSLAKKGYKWLLAHNISPQNRYTFIDIGCSLSRAPNPTVDLLPCMTAARAASCDWWLTPRGGKITTRELFQFQGLTASDYEEWREKTKLSDRQLGILMGNAMSLNVTERFVGKALWCAGLVMKRPPDRWAWMRLCLQLLKSFCIGIRLANEYMYTSNLYPLLLHIH